MYAIPPPSRSPGAPTRVALAACVALLCPAPSARPATPAAGLEAAVAAALDAHPALAVGRAELEAKRFAIAEARSLRLPSLGGRLGRDLAGDGGSVSSVRLRQPVWTFGRVGLEIEHARADREVGRADALVLERELAERAAVAYARALGARDALAAARADADALADLTDRVRRRAAGRLASRADAALAEARLGQARATVERLDAERLTAEAELLALTGEPIVVGPPVPARLVRPMPLEALEAAALGADPSVLLARRRAALARAAVARERARSRPTVYLEASRSADGADAGGDVALGLVVEGALDGLGAVAANRTRALGAGALAAESGVDLARLELERRVRTLHASRRSEATRIAGHEATIARLEDALGSYRRQHEAGRRDWSDLLGLHREAAELRQALARARTDWTVDGISLAALTGRLPVGPSAREAP